MFAKLFSGMYDGTIVQAGWHTLVTFQQLIILADQDGIVDMTPEAIHRRTTIPIEVINEGIENLEKPDEFSRTESEEGRRIIRLNPARSWGWRLVNYEKYRDIRNYNDRREYLREYMKKYRARKQSVNSVSGVNHVDPSYSDSDSDSDSEEKSRNIGATHLTQISAIPELALTGGETHSEPITIVFEHWMSVMGHPNSKLDPKRRNCISAALKLGYTVDQLCEAIAGYRNSPYHMGQDLKANPSGTVYDALTLILRDGTHIDRGLAFAKCGALGAASGPIRKVRAAQESAAEGRKLVLAMARRRDANRSGA